MDALVAAAAVSSVPSTLAAVASIIAVLHGRGTRQAVASVEEKAVENKQVLERVERNTNGALHQKIRELVRDELIANPTNVEEMRALIDAIIYGNTVVVEEDDDTMAHSDNAIGSVAMEHMVMVKRTEWGMKPLGDNHEVRPLSSITEANVHYSDTEPPQNHAHCDDAVRSIDNYHHSKGWAGIAYNRIICPHGYVFIGRPRVVVPAAAENHNAHIVAYCFLTNERATVIAWRAFLEILRYDEGHLNKRLKLTTHREVEPPGYTNCPGDGIEEQVKRERRRRS